MLAGEELELLKHGYRKVFFVAYYCAHCGSCRLMTAIRPQREYIDCHLCSRPHCHSGLPASGYTKRSLPQCEIWCEPVDSSKLTGLSDVKPPKKAAKQREIDSEHFINRRGQVCRLMPR